MSLTRKTRIILLIVAGVCLLAGGTTYVMYNYVFKAGFHEVVPGQVYRAGQPSPEDLVNWVHRYGIRTIGSRGQAAVEVVQEKAQAAQMGLQFVSFDFSASFHATAERMLALVDTFEKQPKPILLHCRQGVDRTGMASGVAIIVLGSGDLDEAIDQLPKIKTTDTPQEIGDVLREYRAYCLQQQIKSGPESFKAWLRDQYHPTATQAATQP